MTPPPPVSLSVQRHVPLAPRTSLHLGGPAQYLVEAPDDETLLAVLAWAREREVPVTLLGGGSNVVVADRGVDGLVVAMTRRGVEWEEGGGAGRGVVRVRAAAGEPWDPLVAATVDQGLTGLECLSGIPGSVGATPIQNVGAYGREVAEVLESVHVLDRRTLRRRSLTPEQCGFGYRDSRFRREPDRFVVLEVTFRLERRGAPVLRYPELEAAVHKVAGTLEREGSDAAKAETTAISKVPGTVEGVAPEPGEPSPGGSITPSLVRRVVLELRRGKSMVIDPRLGASDDPNRRSVGSFFVNPVLDVAAADAVVERAVAAGVVSSPEEVPRYPAETPEQGPRRVKIPAAWLVERAGFPKGTRRGPVAVSSRHSLALVHLPPDERTGESEARTADLLALAREIRRAVAQRFGIVLQPEPVFLGFGPGDPLGPIEADRAR